MNRPEPSIPTTNAWIPGHVVREFDGMTLSASLSGGQVLSWVAEGRERLFRAPASLAPPGSVVRGGVPVIFPQFAMRGPWARHGFARRMPWREVPEPDPARLRLALADGPLTREEWPHAFRLVLDAGLSTRRLSFGLEVSNTGASTYEFCVALHTYLAVEDSARIRLQGLAGHRFHDSTRDEERIDDASVLALDGQEIDRIYEDVDAPLQLHDGARSISIGMHGFRDVVVWNPGPAKAAQLPDLAPGDHLRFVCVEAGRILTPVRLEPGETWRGEQSLSLPSAT